MAENTIGTAYVQIIPSSEGISGSLSSVLDGEAASAGESAGKTLGGSISGGLTSALAGAGKVAAGALAAATTAVTGLATGIMSAAGSTAEYGDKIDKMSQKLGMSSEKYQEWDFILQHSGSSIEALRPSMKALDKAIEADSDAFQKLGISSKELEGMDKTQTFEAVIKGLQGVENETERTQIATKLLGKNAMELGPLLNTSAEDVEAMRKQVHDLGGVMSDEAVKNSAAFQDSLQNLQYAMQGITNNAMAEFLPSITTMMDGMSAAFSGDENGINMVADGLMSMFESAGDILPDLIDKGTQLITQIVQGISDNSDAIGEGAAQIILTLGQALIEIAPTLLDASISIASSLIDGIVSGITSQTGDLGSSGTEIIGNIITGLTTALPELDAQANGLLAGFLEQVEAALPEVLAEGTQIVTQIVTGLVAGMPELLSSAGELINTLFDGLLSMAPELLTAGVDLIVQLVQGISSSLPDIAASAVEVFGMLLNTLLEHLPELLTTGIQLIGELAVGLLQALPDIVSATVTLMTGVIDAILNVDWIGTGKKIVDALIAGLKAAASKIVQVIIDIVKQGIQGAIDFFSGGGKNKSGNKSSSSSNTSGVSSAMRNTAESSTIASSVRDLSASRISGNKSEEHAMIERMDAMLALIAEYLPKCAESQTVVGLSSDDIDRALGLAVM